MRSARNRGVHVRLDFRLRECAVVDSDLVDQAVEPLATDAVAAEAEGAVGGVDRATAGKGAGEGAVDVEAECCAVVGSGQMGPLIRRELRCAERPIRRAALSDPDAWAARLARIVAVVVGVKGVGQLVGGRRSAPRCRWA